MRYTRILLSTSLVLLLAAGTRLSSSGLAAAPSAGGTSANASDSITCPCSLWDDSTVPAVLDSGPDSPVELGVQFRADQDGYITALRFYKGAGNTGTHVGSLWTSTGTRLSAVTFVNETASGWQIALLDAPVPIAANTLYVASYHTDVGHYSFESGYFAAGGRDNGPLHAPATTEAANGLFQYGPAGSFPASTYHAANYWVDAVFSTSVVDTIPPTILASTPSGSAVSSSASIAASFSEPMDPASISSATVELRDSGGALVPGAVTYDDGTQRALLTPSAALAYSSVYTAVVRGGPAGPHVADRAGNPLAADDTWTFTTAGPPPPPVDQGPGGPILVVAGSSNPFGKYYAEILRAEGLNEFAVADLSTVTAQTLSSYDVVLLGETPLTASQVSMFTTWVNGGGRLIAMRPDAQLASLLGLSSAGGTLADAYLLMDTSSGPGAGLVSQTIQYHGPADLYTVTAATPLARLYSTATTSTAWPAASIAQVGSNGGEAAAFTYDLARSVVYTRQGNPAWATQERDGASPVRSDDLFFGGAEPDWVDPGKVAIPQADEQQRLLANLILQMSSGREPLPRFWYFPRDFKAVVIMTGDDHGNGGTAGRFDAYLAASPAGCSVEDWECVRGTSYVYTWTPFSDASAASYDALGFEVGLHVSTNCSDFTASSLAETFTNQLNAWRAKYVSLPGPVTNRTHCIPWSDWSSQPSVELSKGIRLDTNYYYWPAAWVADRPGLFTGSGMPMRFAAADGTMIDVYQAPTQMTDESGQTFPMTIDTLLDNAVGPNGYYGAFTANMHTDTAASPGSDAILASARARGVPIVSARQMLTWLDGRNGSAFVGLDWSGNRLTFGIDVGAGARGLTAMLPATAGTAPFQSLTLDGTSIATARETIKGIDYVTFAAGPGTYVATYEPPVPPDTTITAAPPALGNSRSVTLQFTSTQSGSTFQCALDASAFAACASPKSYASLADGSHTFSVRALDAGGADPTPATAAWTIDATPPAISAITAAPAATTATIAWKTNEPADSAVDYGTSPGSLTSHVSNASRVTTHSLSLTGLTGGTTYYYRVTSRDAANNTASAPATAATFTTTSTRRTQAPGSVTIQSGSRRGGSAASLAANDGSTYSVNSTTRRTRTATWYGSFTGVPASLADLTVTYSGLNSRSVTQTVSIYQWTTGQWVTLNAQTVGTSEKLLTLTPGGSAASYVSSSGELRIRISASSSSSFYSAGDLMQISYDQ
ncbi:MAG TPA: DUF4082 domain-containing protein [Vicinamibacterales bacterium]|nr:DUF4082 domain-containing protein [Vicinamibacterales bacterium]